jgi:hypothetical protein
MKRFKVGNERGCFWFPIFLREGGHVPFNAALDDENHVRAANLEIQKARSIFATIRVPTMAVSTALKEESSPSAASFSGVVEAFPFSIAKLFR